MHSSLERKFHDHQRRAVEMSEWPPLGEWIDENGTSLHWVFCGEVLDGLATLIAFCSRSDPARE